MRIIRNRFVKRETRKNRRYDIDTVRSRGSCQIETQDDRKGKTKEQKREERANVVVNSRGYSVVIRANQE